jgi:hypothetical protein
MKKNYKIILLLVVLAILCVPLILFFSSVDETQDISTQSRGGDILNNKIIKNTNINQYPSDNNLIAPVPNASKTASTPNMTSIGIDSQETNQYIDLQNLRKSYPNGVMVLSVNDPMLSPEEKKEVLAQINNLRTYGSLSGGKVTHEFEKIEEKRNNINNIEKTSFQPTNLDNLVDDSLKITGRLYSGAFNKDTGYDSVYRLYENNSGKKLEATEMYLNPASNAVMQVTKETLNHTISNVPMTFEVLKSQDGSLIYNAQFNLNDKYWSLSGIGYTQASFEQTISKIIDANPVKNN